MKAYTVSRDWGKGAHGDARITREGDGISIVMNLHTERVPARNVHSFLQDVADTYYRAIVEGERE